MIKILRNEKVDIDLVDNPEGLPFVDIIMRDQNTGKITGWHSINKEQLVEIVYELQRRLPEL